MDLSAVIFVVLALAWAVYLIPKALQHHDEVAAEQLDEPVEDRARVLSRRAESTVPATPPVAPAVASTSADESGAATTAPSASSSPRSSRPGRLRRAGRPEPRELTTAGRAARNRRRVLTGLLGVLALVWALTWFAYLPAITPLWPSLAVVGWLVLARVSVVRRQRAARRRPAVAPGPVASVAEVEQVNDATPLVELQAPRAPEAVGPAEISVPDTDASDALWDPLPLTLPTYVGKATARRTVRTIELTGVTSSGHDAGDSALAREAADAATDHQTEAEDEQRRAAGA